MMSDHILTRTHECAAEAIRLDAHHFSPKDYDREDHFQYLSSLNWATRMEAMDKNTTEAEAKARWLLKNQFVGRLFAVTQEFALNAWSIFLQFKEALFSINERYEEMRKDELSMARDIIILRDFKHLSNVVQAFMTLGDFESNGMITLVFRWDRRIGDQVIVIDFVYYTEVSQSSVLTKEEQSAAAIRQSVNNDVPHRCIIPMVRTRRNRVKIFSVELPLDKALDRTLLLEMGLIFEGLFFNIQHMTSASSGHDSTPRFSFSKVKFDMDGMLDHACMRPYNTETSSMRAMNVGLVEIPCHSREKFLEDLFFDPSISKDSAEKKLFSEMKLLQMLTELKVGLKTITRASLPFCYERGRRVSSSAFTKWNPLGIATALTWRDNCSPNTEAAEIFEMFNAVEKPRSERRLLLDFKLERAFFNRVCVGVVIFEGYGIAQHDSQYWDGEDLEWGFDDVFTCEHKKEAVLKEYESNHVYIPSYCDACSPWFTSKFPHTNPLSVLKSRDRVSARIVKRHTCYMTMSIVDDGERKHLSKEQQSTTGQVRSKMFKPFHSPDADERISEIEDMFKIEFGRLCGQAFMLHMENLVFDLHMKDKVGWWQIIMVITSADDSVKSSKAEDPLFKPEEARAWMTDNYGNAKYWIGKKGYLYPSLGWKGTEFEQTSAPATLGKRKRSGSFIEQYYEDDVVLALEKIRDVLEK